MENNERSHRRRQWIALILSGLFPGLGQLYLRAWGKALAFLLVTVGGFWVLGELISLDDLLAGALPLPITTSLVVLALGIVICWSVWDAWRAGKGPL